MSLPNAHSGLTLICFMHKREIIHGQGFLPCLIPTLHLKKPQILQTPSSFKAQQAKELFQKHQIIP